MRALSFPLRKIHSIYIYIDIYIYIYIALFFPRKRDGLFSLLARTHGANYVLYATPRSHRDAMLLLRVYTHRRWLLHSSSGTRNSFFTWRSLRADCFSRHRLYTRCRTHRGRTWRGRAGWTLVYSLFLFLQPDPLPHRPEVSLTTCLFVSFSAFLCLFSTCTSLAFLPADAGELVQRCQATLSPARSQRKTRVRRPIELHFSSGGDGGSLPLLTSRQRRFLSSVRREFESHGS